MLNTVTAGLALDQARGLPRRQRHPCARPSDLVPARRQRHRRGNLATIYQYPVNMPIMRGFEQQVAGAVRAGETVNYTVPPIYRGPS